MTKDMITYGRWSIGRAIERLLVDATGEGEETIEGSGSPGMVQGYWTIPDVSEGISQHQASYTHLDSIFDGLAMA